MPTRYLTKSFSGEVQSLCVEPSPPARPFYESQHSPRPTFIPESNPVHDQTRISETIKTHTSIVTRPATGAKTPHHANPHLTCPGLPTARLPTARLGPRPAPPTRYRHSRTSYRVPSRTRPYSRRQRHPRRSSKNGHFVFWPFCRIEIAKTATRRTGHPTPFNNSKHIIIFDNIKRIKHVFSSICKVIHPCFARMASASPRGPNWNCVFCPATSPLTTKSPLFHQLGARAGRLRPPAGTPPPFPLAGPYHPPGPSVPPVYPNRMG